MSEGTGGRESIGPASAPAPSDDGPDPGLSVAEAAERIKRKASEPPAAAPEPEPARERKAAPPDDGKSDLNWRQAGALIALRQEEAARAAAYGAQGEQPKVLGEASGEQHQSDPDLDLQQQHAALETERQAAAQLQAEQARISNLSEQEQHLKWSLNQELVRFHQGYRDITGPEDLERLRVNDPVRHAQFMHHLGALSNAKGKLDQLSQARFEAGRAEFMQRATEHDKHWESMHPELKDPAKFQQVTAGARAVLDHIGLTGEDLQRLWRGDEAISLRDWRVQEALMMAGQYMASQQALEQSRAANRNNKQLPAVNRPGVRHDRADAGQGRYERALQRADRATREGRSNARDIAAAISAKQRLAERH